MKTKQFQGGKLYVKDICSFDYFIRNAKLDKINIFQYYSRDEHFYLFDVIAGPLFTAHSPIQYFEETPIFDGLHELPKNYVDAFQQMMPNRLKDSIYEMWGLY